MTLKKEIDNLPAFLFHQGTNCKAYEYMGAHKENGRYVFRVWAPNADAVYLVGDFNAWGEDMPMYRVTDGIWEYVDNGGRIFTGDIYKYKIWSHGRAIYKTDPYGVYCEKTPNTASVLYESQYEWKDESFTELAKKNAGEYYDKPMNVYEVHLGSWKRHDDGSYLTYCEIANELSAYAQKMGYTHVELLPVMEHPYDGSWGYQVGCYYAPTSRFGTPDDFRAFVDTMHNAGIGVILDWVPAHFPKDEHGLYEFDGSPLYEYQGADRMEHRGWGTRCFDVGRTEVQSFLISNAIYWLEEFHADGLRVDAVASMLYLDCDKAPGEWIPNIYGDNKNLEAIAFFKKLNSTVKSRCPHALMIAEESSAFGNVTSFDNDGLGFDLKWNMGWMNDGLEYVKIDPYFRKYNHDKMTFSLTYAFSEKFILPISHDEVVHGKLSLLDKMYGDYAQKFAGARAFATYMMTHPGKKLSFMGNEFGPFREWDEKASLEWFMLDFDMHSKLQLFHSELNRFYLETPALWQNDGNWDSFNWIDPDNREESVLSYKRIDREGNEVIVVLNFTPVRRNNFEVGVSKLDSYVETFNSDAKKYGGEGILNRGELRAVEIPTEREPYSIRITLPPHAAVILKKGKISDIQTDKTPEETERINLLKEAYSMNYTKNFGFKHKAGIVMPVSSLPSKYGIGSFGKAAHDFIDFLDATGQKCWQVLPLNPTSYGDSPYQSPSSVAGNPYFIDLDILAEKGLLNYDELEEQKDDSEKINYGRLFNVRYSVLRLAYSRFSPDKAYRAFVKKNSEWLEDYALFMALKVNYNFAQWTAWAEEHRDYDKAIENKAGFEGEMSFWRWIQYEFSAQWQDILRHAHEKGIMLIGDMPIYVAHDSMDVWAAPEQFLLDENFNPTVVAGCPPDGFSPDGQLWGNPIYNWELMEKDGFSWWVNRVRLAFSLYDILRIDHFRGFSGYYNIPYGDTTARNGKWDEAPGIALFTKIAETFPKAKIIAEDLGFITEDVRELLLHAGCPGMKMLHFAFYDDDSEYLPRTYDTKNCVVYASSHDSDCTYSWLKNLDKDAKKRFNKECPRVKGQSRVYDVIEFAFTSIANLAIVPMQDYLELSNEEGRMNTPATAEGNWAWRVTPRYNNARLRKKILDLTEKTGRAK